MSLILVLIRVLIRVQSRVLALVPAPGPGPWSDPGMTGPGMTGPGMDDWYYTPVQAHLPTTLGTPLYTTASPVLRVRELYWE